jgi:TonB family protein
MKRKNRTITQGRLLLFTLIGLVSQLQAATEPVRLKEGTPPPFPESLKLTGEGGMAKVKVLISEEGMVTEAELVSATRDAFGASALAAVRAWTFHPATEDGVPVPQTVTIPVVFNLSPEDKLNARLGREVFVDIDKLTDRVYLVKEADKWTGFRNKSSNRIPYPDELKGSGISEVVTVRLVISPQGYALNPAIENIRNKELMMPAIQHVAGVRFKVPKVGGQPAYVQQKMKFICSEDPEFGVK